MKKTGKKNPMKCGFCNTEIEKITDFFRRGGGAGKTVFMCPHCNSILGIK